MSESQGIHAAKEKVFEIFGVPRSSGYRLLHSESRRRRHNNPTKLGSRGRKKIITSEQIRDGEDA